uniref:(northern house mosquito) hypothetical protein n=1 Tax=Culex pipiens TaxID=7175 RepID=A0A8D8G7V2_CULPI
MRQNFMACCWRYVFKRKSSEKSSTRLLHLKIYDVCVCVCFLHLLLILVVLFCFVFMEMLRFINSGTKLVFMWMIRFVPSHFGINGLFLNAFCVFFFLLLFYKIWKGLHPFCGLRKLLLLLCCVNVCICFVYFRNGLN